MIELNSDRYELLHEYVMKVPFNMLMARSVICGHANGRIFVDSSKSLQSFYIVHSYGMTFLCGYSGNETFNKNLFEYFSSCTRKKEEWLQAFPRDWDAVMARLVDERKAIQYSRVNFKHDADIFYDILQQTNKSQYEIVSTPIDMLFEISGSVIPKDYIKTPIQFDGLTKGYTVIINGKPAATAFTSARHDDKLEIGIETVNEYRGKGLGYFACAKLIEYCIKNGIEPIWSCRHENTASVKLANKLGFIEALKMPYYHIPM